MVLFTPSYMVVFFVFCIFVHFMDMAQSCDKDAHCKPHQVCCGKRCRSWPKCFLNSDKECHYDTHCVKGAVCVSNVCKSRKQLPTSCTTHEDCDNRNISSSHDKDVSHVKCCQGKCLNMKNCLQLLKINSTLTTPTTSRAIRGPCLEDFNCTSGLECTDDKCTETTIAHHSENTEELPNSTLLSYKRGILSAVILVGVVFLALICYCCLKETKYAKKYCSTQGQVDDTTMSSSNCSYQVGNLSTVSPLENVHAAFTCRNNQNGLSSQFTASWILFPGLYGLSSQPSESVHGAQDRNCEQQEDCNSSCTRPPSYRSVRFDHELPPSYDEAMNCHCQNHQLYNIPGDVYRTGMNI